MRLLRLTALPYGHMVYHRPVFASLLSSYDVGLIPFFFTAFEAAL